MWQRLQVPVKYFRKLWSIDTGLCCFVLISIAGAGVGLFVLGAVGWMYW